MKKIFLAGVFIWSAFASAEAQNDRKTNPVIDLKFGYVTELDKSTSSIVGSAYHNDEWQMADVYLKKEYYDVDTLYNIPVKLNLLTNNFEINTEKGVRLLEGYKVNGFQWLNFTEQVKSQYFNCENYNADGSKLSGFCKVLSTGKLSLVEHYYLLIQKPNYNVATSSGSKDSKIIKKQKLYLLKENELVEFKKSSLEEILTDKKDIVKKYIKEQHLNLNKKEDVQTLINYYNTI